MNGDAEDALYFELDGSVSLTCPDCDETLYLEDDEAPTLGDILQAAREHRCENADAAAGGNGS